MVGGDLASAALTFSTAFGEGETPTPDNLEGFGEGVGNGGFGDAAEATLGVLLKLVVGSDVCLLAGALRFGPLARDLVIWIKKS